MAVDGTTSRPLFTIGHSNHEMGRFLELLRMHGVTAIADVRSQPYSQYNTQYNLESLRAVLKASGIAYAFLGEELGARRNEEESYISGKARYDLIAQLPLFRKGLERVLQGVRSQRVALMCSEKDPLACHRTILICRHLRHSGLAIRHIMEDGGVQTHEQAESRLLELLGLSGGHLFQSPEDLLELAYERQADAIAFARGAALCADTPLGPTSR